MVGAVHYRISIQIDDPIRRLASPKSMADPAKLDPEAIRSLAAAHGVVLDRTATQRIADAFGANLAISQADAHRLPFDLEPSAWGPIAKRCGGSR
jgi:hypothetical protein